MIHPSKLRYLFLVKSVCATIAAFSLLGWAVKTGGTGPVFSQTSSIHGSTKSWAYLYGVNVVVSSRTTLALNIVREFLCTMMRPQLTHHPVRPDPLRPQGLGHLLAGPVYSHHVLGLFLHWHRRRLVQPGHLRHPLLGPHHRRGRWENRAAAFFCAAAFGLATLGTNISTNSVAASNDLAFMVPRWINLRRGSFIVSIIGGWATVAWKIQASATTLTTFLSGYAIVLAPILAVMICDYYIIHRGRFNVPMLYQNEGIYRYHGGFNWRAIVAIFVAVPVNLPGLIHAINTKVPIGNHAYFCTSCWLGKPHGKLLTVSNRQGIVADCHDHLWQHLYHSESCVPAQRHLCRGLCLRRERDLGHQGRRRSRDGQCGPDHANRLSKVQYSIRTP